MARARVPVCLPSSRATNPIFQLPIYLCPNFPTRFDQLVLVSWYGIDQIPKRVGLKIELPQSEKRVFYSFHQCVQYLMHPSQILPMDIQECWIAFSYTSILPFLQFYFQHRHLSPSELQKYIPKYQFPLRMFLQSLDAQPKTKYFFEFPSEKHTKVREVTEFLSSTQTVETVKTEGETKGATKPEAVDVEELELASKWTIEDWKNTAKVDEYFSDSNLRIETQCQHDPTLVSILEWKAESYGGWDLTFHCEFMRDTTSARAWLHYSALQVNPLYKKVLNDYILTQPSIQRHVEQTS